MTASRPRPWLQFRLRSILVLMLVVAGYCAGRMASQRELEQAQAAVLESREAERRSKLTAMLSNAQAQIADDQARVLTTLLSSRPLEALERKFAEEDLSRAEAIQVLIAERLTALESADDLNSEPER